MARPLQPSGPTVGLAMTTVTYPLPPAYSPPQPTLSSPPVSAPPPLWARSFWLGRGGAQERGGCFAVIFSLLTRLASCLLLLLSSPCLAALASRACSSLVLNTIFPLPLLLRCGFRSCHAIRKMKRKGW